MKSRLVLLACCLALLSSCGQGTNDTGKVPEFAVTGITNNHCQPDKQLIRLLLKVNKM